MNQDSNNLEQLAVDEEPDLRLSQGMLSFDRDGTIGRQSHASTHILKSLASAAKVKRSNTVPSISLTNGDTTFDPVLRFEVVSARIVDEEQEKKHVAYTMLVRKEGALTDPNPAVVERRYSDFLALYDTLRRDFPTLMAPIVFPKKLLLNNFAPDVIAQRSAGFEALLALISANEKLKDSACLTHFLQGKERDEARRCIQAQRYDQAYPLLENTFRLLNKFHTDRHPAVMLALCHLVACSATDPRAFNAARYSELALRRYEGVSDADLLRFYVPLLQLCVHLRWQLDAERADIEARLEDLKRRGMRVDGEPTLMDALMALK